jgi:hypothetical protein
VVTICTNCSNIQNNSVFCPHSVLMCFVWIWEQTAIISLYSIDWLVGALVGSAVLNIIKTNFSVQKGKLQAHLPHVSSIRTNCMTVQHYHPTTKFLLNNKINLHLYITDFKWHAFTMYMLLQQQSTNQTTQFTEPCTSPAWSNPQTYAAGCFICGDTGARDNYQLPLIVFMGPTRHTYMVECLSSRQNTDPVDHHGIQFFGTPCPQWSQKRGMASVKCLTWQHLHWTAEVDQGHNWYERQRQSTQSMVTVGLWR